MDLRNNETPEQSGGVNQYYDNNQNPYGYQGYNQNPYGNQNYNQNPYGNQNYNQNLYGNQGYNSNPYYQNNAPEYAPGQMSYGTGAIAAFNTILGKSFLYMFIALLVTGITSLFVASSPSIVRFFFGSGTMAPFIICCIIELALVFGCSAAIRSNNLTLSAVLFFSYAVVNGLTFSVIFLAYQLSSIVTIFLMTSAIFAVLSFIGAVTKKDLSNLGTILLAGLFGIIIASIINWFIGSSMVDMVVTILGIVIFMGLTIYDVNKIRKLANENIGLSANVIGLYGAMELYLDFINLFLKLLRLFGKRK